ncbi:hypothetical protein GGI21_002593, partial [Coemansia aciculifera]
MTDGEIRDGSTQEHEDNKGGGGGGGKYNNARDTRSYASDSTAFSRAASPLPSPVSSPTPSQHERLLVQQQQQQGAGSPVYLSHDDSNVRTRPSSALDSTPDSVSQLGEALSRWKSTQRNTLYTPSPLSRDPSLPPSQSQGIEYNNLPVQDGAVTAAAPRSDEVLFPLTSSTVALATPDSTNPQTPQASSEPPVVPKVVDLSKRLSPLPNPKAPKIEPTMRDGRPQLFDYTPPATATASAAAAVLVQSNPLPAVAARRERSHVEIETTDHASYGFVSNPSAL